MRYEIDIDWINFILNPFVVSVARCQGIIDIKSISCVSYL